MSFFGTGRVRTDAEFEAGNRRPRLHFAKDINGVPTVVSSGQSAVKSSGTPLRYRLGGPDEVGPALQLQQCLSPILVIATDPNSVPRHQLPAIPPTISGRSR